MNRFKQLVQMKLNLVKPYIEKKAKEMEKQQQSQYELCEAVRKLSDMSAEDIQTMLDYRIIVDFDQFVVQATEITFTALNKERGVYLLPLSKMDGEAIHPALEESFFQAFNEFRNCKRPLEKLTLMESPIDGGIIKDGE